jgi:hypothetical protein
VSKAKVTVQARGCEIIWLKNVRANYKLELNERLENTEMGTKLAKDYGVAIHSKQDTKKQ